MRCKKASGKGIYEEKMVQKQPDKSNPDSCIVLFGGVGSSVCSKSDYDGSVWYFVVGRRRKNLYGNIRFCS